MSCTKNNNDFGQNNSESDVVHVPLPTTFYGLSLHFRYHQKEVSKLKTHRIMAIFRKGYLYMGSDKFDQCEHKAYLYQLRISSKWSLNLII